MSSDDDRLPVDDLDHDLRGLVARANDGDGAARDALFTALYAELHGLAQAHLRRSAGPVTIGATTLLHEAYLRIARRDTLVFPDENRFLGYASRAMRGLIIDYVRNRRAEKRGGELTFITLHEESVAAGAGTDLEALGRALDSLAEIEPRLAELVDLKFFCGFTFGEIAALRDASERTVQRDWAKARILLHRFLSDA